MVWYYCRTIDLPLGTVSHVCISLLCCLTNLEGSDSSWCLLLLIELWNRYSEVFDSIWVASAFKGATGPCMFATDIAHHVENHKSWLTVVCAVISPRFKSFRGYAVTGWSRYDAWISDLSCLFVALWNVIWLSLSSQIWPLCCAVWIAASWSPFIGSVSSHPEAQWVILFCP